MKKHYEINTDCNTDFVKKNTAKGESQYHIDIAALIEFLHCNGFRKLAIPNNDFTLVRITNGRIIETTREYMLKDIVFQYLDQINKSHYKQLFHTQNVFTKNLITSFETIEYNSINGSRDTTYLYYNNGILCITRDSMNIINYSDFDNYIWKDQILSRDFSISEFEDFNFKRFIQNVAGGNNRFFSLISIIGYLLHDYKDRTVTKAIIFTDEKIDYMGKEANGGTGKSLVASALAKMTSVCIKEGKNIETNNRFFFQDVEEHHKILYFDDVRKDLNFETFYSAITGEIVSEKKFKSPTPIPFEKVPKILISSNYIVKGTGGYTDERRRIDFEFSDYYNKYLTPAQEFKQVFFVEWSEQDWAKFDTFMAYCIQFYLQHGLFEVPKINLEKNRIIQQTHISFVNFIETKIEQGKTYNKSLLYNQFLEEYGDEVSYVSKITFKHWLDVYIIDHKKWIAYHYKSDGNYLVKVS
ncbi:MAG: hypothetical protein JWN78_1087 [Bacteroidota bacterium]|nr:hypothetical protein [Bacteroidota bacterium]